MRKNHPLLIAFLASLILAAAQVEVVEAISPGISFEKMVCDLGHVGLSTKNACEFKFTNTGQAMLKITNIRSTCGCTVAKLEKKEYAPGQSGTIKVSYTAPKTATTTQKYIYVSSNDKANPKIRLTIRAKVAQIVQANPAKLLLYKQVKPWQAMREDRRGTPGESMEAIEKNLGLGEITVKSLDEKPFSIKSFSSTNCNCITADIDPRN